MSSQCKVDKSFFKEFANCSKSKEQYIAELTKSGVIIPIPEKAENSKK